jgi:hypothetical protein
VIGYTHRDVITQWSVLLVGERIVNNFGICDSIFNLANFTLDRHSLLTFPEMNEFIIVVGFCGHVMCYLTVLRVIDCLVLRFGFQRLVRILHHSHQKGMAIVTISMPIPDYFRIGGSTWWVLNVSGL